MKRLTLPDGEFYYENRGKGQPVALLHSGIADHRMWEAQFSTLAEKFHAVRCDLRGYGQSHLPNGKFSYVGDLDELIQSLGLERSWLLGASLGAQVAVDYYLSHPERVKGLILVSPTISGFKPAGEVEKFNEAEEKLLEEGKLEEAVELNLKMWVDGPSRSTAEVDPAIRSAVAEMQSTAFSQPVPEHVSLLRLEPPAYSRLNEVRVPVLIISGELDAAEFLHLAECLERGIAGARRIVIPNSAHMATMEAPEMCNQNILDFINQ